MIKLKSARDIKVIKDNCLILQEIVSEIQLKAEQGVSTGDLNRLAEELMKSFQVEPAFKGYRGFPASICTSLNEEVVHGIPSDRRVLKEGDLLSIDMGIKRKGFYADLARSFPVGNGHHKEAEKIIAVCQAALRKGIQASKADNRVSDISHAIGSYIEREGFYVVKQFVGHGVGRELHEDPQVPNYGPPAKGSLLRAGMILALEPMVKQSPQEVDILDDGWTVVTPDSKMSAHEEDMVLVTNGECEVLTRSKS